MAVDFTTDVGKVRALIPDIAPLKNPRNLQEPAAYLFEDPHLQAFLDINNGNIKLAAADAIEAVGSDELMTLKVIKTDDKESDGSKILDAFVKRAIQLRKQANLEDGNDDGFGIHPFVYQPVDWAWRG